MKTLGIIGAMEEEIAALKAKLEVITAKNIIGIDFYMGKMSGKNVVLVRSGIGKVNAAICAQVLIDLYGVDYIIHVGVAGAVSKEVDVGDVVISDDLVQHDFDTSATGDPVGVIPRMPQSFFKADEELIRLAKEAAAISMPEGKKVYVGRIATGDQFVSSSPAKHKIWNNFKAFCSEMEGAAVAQTCFLNKLPFVVIRVVSDKCDEEANISYEKFLKEAVITSSTIVDNMVKAI